MINPSVELRVEIGVNDFLLRRIFMFYSHKKMNIVVRDCVITKAENVKFFLSGPDPFYYVEFLRGK